MLCPALQGGCPACPGHRRGPGLSTWAAAVFGDSPSCFTLGLLKSGLVGIKVWAVPAAASRVPRRKVALQTQHAGPRKLSSPTLASLGAKVGIWPERAAHRAPASSSCPLCSVPRGNSTPCSSLARHPEFTWAPWDVCSPWPAPRSTGPCHHSPTPRAESFRAAAVTGNRWVLLYSNISLFSPIAFGVSHRYSAWRHFSTANESPSTAVHSFSAQALGAKPGCSGGVGGRADGHTVAAGAGTPGLDTLWWVVLSRVHGAAWPPWPGARGTPEL